jgi:hypothetical protein
MSGEEIVWEAPPEQSQRRTMYGPTVGQLKKRPGQWARIRVLPTQSGAYGARKGFLKTADDERFEATTGAIEENGKVMYGVWARYRSDEQMKAKR